MQQRQKLSHLPSMNIAALSSSRSRMIISSALVAFTLLHTRSISFVNPSSDARLSAEERESSVCGPEYFSEAG